MITVSGASDDLIEIDGDIVEEFYTTRLGGRAAYEGDLIAFSDGTILRVRLDHAGVWRIHSIAEGTATLTVKTAPEDDDSDRSDVATLTGAVWVVHGVGWASVGIGGRR